MKKTSKIAIVLFWVLFFNQLYSQNDSIKFILKINDRIIELNKLNSFFISTDNWCYTFKKSNEYILYDKSKITNDSFYLCINYKKEYFIYLFNKSNFLSLKYIELDIKKSLTFFTAKYYYKINIGNIIDATFYKRKSNKKIYSLFKC